MRRGLVIAALVPTVILVIVAAVVGWLAFDVHRSWARLDKASRAFEVPAGLTEVARIRQGTALCFVSCTGGGEAIITIVMTARELPAETACSELRQAVEKIAQDTKQGRAIEAYQCNWTGALGGGSTAWGIVAWRADLKPLGPRGLYGPRWTERTEIPDEPLLVWVEFNSGIE
jgi:hypothetical protein